MHRPSKGHAIVDYLSRLDLGEAHEGIQDEFPNAELFVVITIMYALDWYIQMFNFLNNRSFPEKMKKDQRRKIALRSSTFLIITGFLYRKGINQVIKRCVPNYEQMAILEEAHSGVAGGHFSG